MLDSVAWSLFGLLWQLIEEFGGLILLAGVAGVFHLRLRTRVLHLNRRLDGLEQRALDSIQDRERHAPPARPSTDTPQRGTSTRSPWAEPIPPAAMRSASGGGPAPDAAAASVAAPPPPLPAPEHGPESESESESESALRVEEAPSANLDAVVQRDATAVEAATAAPFASGPEPGFLVSFFSGGNWLVRGGVLVLFLGVGFLLKFAADHSLLPVELRLAGVGLGGAFLVWSGLRLAPVRRAYALTLQGGGVGLLYLTLYAAFRLYALIPASVAFALMLALVVAAGWLAVRQNALILAVLGALGGFAAPLLASTGSGSHVLLFSYYALLNLGVLGLAVFRAWRPLNLVGFAATFGISALWGARFYSDAYFASVEPFLILFFAMYLGVAVLFALTRSLQLNDPMDSTLVFGTPLVAFGLQSQLLSLSEYGLAITAACLCVVYALAAWLLHRRAGARLAVLVQAFVALALGFAALAPALAFDARWTSASWALEGAALVWVGWRQDWPLARVAGMLLQLFAGGALLWHGMERAHWETGDWLGTLMLAVAGLLSGAVLNRSPAGARGGGEQRVMAAGLGLWGLLWWLGGGLVHLDHVLATRHEIGAMLLFLAATSLALEIGGQRLRWQFARIAAALLPAVLVVAMLAQVLVDDHPLTALAALGWPLSMLVCALVLWRQDADAGRVVNAMHPLGLWLLAALGAWECAWWFEDAMAPVQSWQRLGWLLPPALLVALVSRGVAARRYWPFVRRATHYLGVGAGPLVCILAGGVFALGVDDPGRPWPITYVPVLNPLDVGLLVVLGAMLLWLRAGRGQFSAHTRNVLAVCGASLGFAWLNGVLLRTLHFWWDVPYRIGAMLESTLTQASLSVLWATTGLVIMVGASRAGARALWRVGAVLMGVVVVKLMLVDLASSGTIARIVSFISVGLLLMLVGYLAPVPPNLPPNLPPNRADARRPAAT